MYNVNDTQTIEKIRAINARLYCLMFEAYNRVAQIKTVIDGFIAQGKSYYKGYQIKAEIECYHDDEEGEPLPLVDGEKFDLAECEWTLKTEYGKKMPSKMKALDLWNNYQSYFGGIGDYYCRAMYDFAYPTIEYEQCRKYKQWHKIPDNIFPLLNPDDFQLYITLSIGRETLPTDISREELYKWELWPEFKPDDENGSSIKKILKKIIKKLPIPFEDVRTLHLAKKLLELELKAADFNNIIKKDFAELEKTETEVAKAADFDTPQLIYHHRHIFGIKTRKEKAIENVIETHGSSFFLNVEEVTKEKSEKHPRILTWFEHYNRLPYNNHYLPFSFHCLNEHCGLTRRQFLALKPRNFKIGLDITFDF